MQNQNDVKIKEITILCLEKVNSKLKKYVENNIFPLYNRNEKGHGVNHIKYVINRSFEIILENNLDVNYDIVYVVASYHDIGHYIDSKRHEIISAQIMLEDKNLKNFFDDQQIIAIKEAIEDHRASSKSNPRSIYGKIVSSADRNNTIEDCLIRTYTYGKRLDPNATDEELFSRAYDALVRKFGESGYAKFYFKDKTYEDFLSSLRKLLLNKDVFIKTQRDYIGKLKNENMLWGQFAIYKTRKKRLIK